MRRLRRCRASENLSRLRNVLVTLGLDADVCGLPPSCSQCGSRLSGLSRVTDAATAAAWAWMSDGRLCERVGGLREDDAS